jgi:hypothetical protein
MLHGYISPSSHQALGVHLATNRRTVPIPPGFATSRPPYSVCLASRLLGAQSQVSIATCEAGRLASR